MLNLMIWEKTTLVRQWENDIVIYKANLPGNDHMHNGYEA